MIRTSGQEYFEVNALLEKTTVQRIQKTRGTPVMEITCDLSDDRQNALNIVRLISVNDERKATLFCVLLCEMICIEIRYVICNDFHYVIMFLCIGLRLAGNDCHVGSFHYVTDNYNFIFRFVVYLFLLFTLVIL